MKILVIQNKMGIGDMVIYLPFIKSISKKFSCPITLLVKESTKADQYLNRASYIDEIIYLKRNNNKNDKHDGFVGSIKLSIELKNKRFDKVFILNSSLRFYLICKLANIKEIFQYPLFKKKNQHIINAAKDLIRNTLNLEVESNPNIEILDEEIINAKKKFNINKDKRLIKTNKIFFLTSSSRIKIKQIDKIIIIFIIFFYLIISSNYLIPIP